MTLSALDAEWTRRYQAALQHLRDQLGTVASAAWLALPAHNEANIPELVSAITAATEQARHMAAQVTSGYIAQLATAPPVPVEIATPDMPVLWRAPFISTWQALGNGMDRAAALDLGTSRLLATAGDTITNAAYDQAGTVHDGSGDRIIGWNRAVDAAPCAWCMDVADQLYTTADAADFGHDRCGCTPIPVFA